MNILLVGDWRWPWYESACADALTALGHNVTPVSGGGDYLLGWHNGCYSTASRPLADRIQEKFLAGPRIRAYNRRLERLLRESQPDVAWVYNCRWIYEDTVRRAQIALPDTRWVLYANDNPFGKKRWPDFWRHFLRSIPHADLLLAYRPANLTEFREHGARRALMLRSYFVPSDDFRLSLAEIGDAYRSDVVYVGHYEPDGRLEALEALTIAGHHVRVFGGAWEPVSDRILKGPLADQWPIKVRFGHDYRQAICGSKIALSFLSRINRDTYTRRNFQIPAMGTFMLSEYSEDLATLFSEGVDAEFFRSPEELSDKVTYYLKNDAARTAIARRGFERVHRDGHDVVSRMRQFIDMVETLDLDDRAVRA